jgi:hypothetical protein
MKTVRLIPLPLLTLLFATSAAAAVDGYGCEVTYSLEVPDGGLFVRNITETSGGLGDVRFFMDPVDPGPSSVTVFDASPMWVVIDYTADEATDEILDGPVELLDVYYDQHYQIAVFGATATTETETVIARTVEGVLAGDLITWDNLNPLQLSTTGTVSCVGAFCPGGSFEEILEGDPVDQELPLFTVFETSEFGDDFSSDNDTPAPPNSNELDDILEADDPDAVIWITWHGAETARVCPEPGALLLQATSLLTLGLLSRCRRPRSAGAAR